MDTHLGIIWVVPNRILVIPMGLGIARRRLPPEGMFGVIVVAVAGIDVLLPTVRALLASAVVDLVNARADAARGGAARTRANDGRRGTAPRPADRNKTARCSHGVRSASISNAC
jgi:hypothetical protein